MQSMYLFRIFYSFLPLRNPIGFGAVDLVLATVALILTLLIFLRHWLAPWIRQIAGRTRPSMLLLFLLPVLMRVALLGGSPQPAGTGGDDFSYILLADTLRHFRMANPPNALHQFFETTFVLQEPTYSSIYPMGQGLVMAAGWLLTRSFWIGVLLSGGIFCALCYWMLTAWTKPVWAFTGALLAVIQFGALSSWMNSYWGGYVSGIAGCLVFGALPRLKRQQSFANGAWLGAGLALQVLTRPFESLALGIATASYLGWAFRGDWKRALRPIRDAGLFVCIALVVTLLQNYAVTRTWTTLPYQLSRYQYGVPTTFTFQPNPVPHVSLTPQQELDYQAQAAIHGEEPESISRFGQRWLERVRFLRFFVLPPLYIALLAAILKFRERELLWAGGIVLLFSLACNFYPYFFPHYVAAITCLMILLTAAGLQRLGTEMRMSLLTTSFGIFSFWFVVYLAGNEKLAPLMTYQSWAYLNQGDPQGRLEINRQLSQSTGRQLVFVSYSPSHRFQEWVKNDADIDAARVVWANDLGSAENQKLVDHFPNRKAWILYPDNRPISLLPYPKTSDLFQTVQ